MRNRVGVRGRLFMAFFGISAFAVLAAAAAMYSFLEVGKALDRITRQRVPSVLSSLEISRQAERIVAVAPTLLTVTTPAQRERLSGKIGAELERLDALLSGLQGSGGDTAVLESIERDVAQLETNFDALDILVAKRLEAGERKSALLRRLSNTHNAAQRLITPGLMVVEGDLSQLRRVLDARDLSSEARIASVSGLVSSIAASPPLQRIQIEALNINDMLRRVASAPRPGEVAILALPLKRSLDLMESLADRIGPVLRRRLLARIEALRNFVDGPESILDARRNELTILTYSEGLLGENAALSAELTEAIDLLVAGANRDIGRANLEALSVQRVGTGVMIAVVALSLISSTLIVWLYVGRNLIARLTALSGSMLAIAGGQLDTSVPAAGGDEIGAMAEALAVFRDTAIEVKETNLREIREARIRLVDAIESISEGFSLYDSEDRLVVSNTRYRELLFPDSDDAAEQGTPFETIIRKAAEKGYIEGTEGRMEEWLSERLTRHRDPGEPQLEHRADGRWIQVSERRTEDRGIVAVYTDVTELRRAEEEVRKVWDAIEELREGFALYDSDDRLVKCNQRYREIFSGLADMLVPGTSFEDILDAAITENLFSNDERREAWKRARIEEHHQPSEEGLLQRYDDRWILVKEHRTQDGGYLSIRTDVTELKRAEEALSDQLKFTEALVDTIPNPITVKSPERRYVNFNRAYEEAFGIRREDYIGKTVMEREHIRLDLRKHLYREDEEVLRTGGTMHHETVRVLSDGKEHDMLSWRTAFELSSGVTGGLVGVLVDISEQKSMERDLGAARDAAETARLALEEAYEVIKGRSKRMEDELSIAREIQMSMVPLIFPPFPSRDEFSIFAMLEPAREVGGDFYDFYFIDEHRLCVCIGDVSGKGVPSALFMAVAKTLIKSRATEDFSTASILTHVNDELSADNKECMFVTLFIAIVDIVSGEAVYTNGGHNPPYIRRGNGTLRRLDERHGPVIGAMEGMVYGEDTIKLDPGDVLFLYTDGVTEAMDGGENMFSDARLMGLLEATDANTVETIVKDIVTAVETFEDGAAQTDDVTVLAFQFHGGSRASGMAELRISIKNELSEIAKVIEAFEAFAAEHGLRAPITMKFSIALDELLSNVISFAYRDEGDHDIATRVELVAGRLTVTLTDDGVPFNPLSAKPPDTEASLEDREIGGLGIHLVRSLVDDVSYHRRIDKNVLTLMKRVDPDDS